MEAFINLPDAELKKEIDERGVVFRIESMREYLAQKQFISAGKLHDIINLTPRRFYFKFLNPPKETDALRLGSALHTLVLEEQEFLKRYAIFYPDNRPEPNMTFASARNKAFKEKFINDCEMLGKVILTVEEEETLRMMNRSLKNNATTANILSQPGITELSVYTKISHNDRTYYIKIRPDKVSLIKPFYLDLKSTRDASPANNKFPSDAFRFGYDIKVSLYYDILKAHWMKLLEFAQRPSQTGPAWALAGKELKRALIIAIEDSAPFDIAVYNIPEETMDLGRYRYMAALDRFGPCIEKQEWPGYEIHGANDQGIFDLVLPKYAQSEIVI